MLLLLVAFTARASDPTTPIGDCFPLRQSVLAEFTRTSADAPDGVCTDRVFVEEWSACEGRGTGGALDVADVDGLGTLTRTGDILVALVDTYNRGPGLDYEVVQAAGGWVVRPTGVERLFDTRLDLDPNRFTTITDQFQDLKDQLLQQRGVHIGRQPTFDPRNTTATGVTPGVMTFLDAIAAIHLPLEEIARSSVPTEPVPRFGLILSVADARNAASTRIVRCEEPSVSTPRLFPHE